MCFYKLVSDDSFPLHFQGLENAMDCAYKMSGTKFEWEHHDVCAGESVYKSKLKSDYHKNASRFEIWIISIEDAN